MLVVQHWLAIASLLCSLPVVTWLAEPLPITAVPEEPEISTVGCDVIDMLGNGSAAFIFAEARTHGVLAEEPTSRLLPPNRVASLAR